MAMKIEDEKAPLFAGRPEVLTTEDAAKLAERLDAIARRCGQLPVRKRRARDVILGYGD
jgi:hypothetical protein